MILNDYLKYLNEGKLTAAKKVVSTTNPYKIDRLLANIEKKKYMEQIRYMGGFYKNGKFIQIYSKEYAKNSGKKWNKILKKWGEGVN